MNQLTLRPAQPQDFPFCQRLYFEGRATIIAQLGLDEACRRKSEMALGAQSRNVALPCPHALRAGPQRHGWSGLRSCGVPGSTGLLGDMDDSEEGFGEMAS